MEDKNIIEFIDVDIGHSNNLIVGDVSLSIKEEDFVLITSSKNSGKTTLLETIVGITKPLSGHISVHGEKNFLDYNHLISYIPQYFKLNSDTFSSLDVILMGIITKKSWFPKLSESDKESSLKLFNLLDIDKSPNDKFSNLSLLEKKKVLIARSLINDPKVLVLDEIDEDLNLKERVKLANFLKKIKKKRNLTILLSSKYFNQYNHIINKILFLEKNKNKSQIHYGEPKKIITEKLLKGVYRTNIKSFNDGENIYIVNN